MRTNERTVYIEPKDYSNLSVVKTWVEEKVKIYTPEIYFFFMKEDFNGIAANDYLEYGMVKVSDINTPVPKFEIDCSVSGERCSDLTLTQLFDKFGEIANSYEVERK